MNLYKIQNDLIADRSAEAWYQTKIDGPYFHYRWMYGTGRGGNFSYVESEHRGHAVCREEPSLTMSWGMEVDDRDDARHFSWAEKFPDSTVRPIWVDFFWNNALIDRVELCRVDGSRGLVPTPNFKNEVTDFELAVAYLVHNLEDGDNYLHPGRVMETIGATRVGDHDRGGAGSPT